MKIGLTFLFFTIFLFCPKKKVEQLPKKVYLLIEVEDFGKIKIELFPNIAPKNVTNIIKLAEEGFYNGLTFHRVVPNFVIQGGDPKGDGTGGPGYDVEAEISDLKHRRGTVAMARLPDIVNPERRSSGSQFYICISELPQLDGKYTIIGQVVQGMEIVDKIAQIERDERDKPLKPVVMKKVSVVK